MFRTSVLSTHARNDNQSGRRKTAVLRHQSDDSRRIDRDALGRVRGGVTRIADVRLAVSVDVTPHATSRSESAELRSVTGNHYRAEI